VFTLPDDWQHDDETFKRDMTLLPGRARLAVEMGCRRAVTTILPGSQDRPIHQNFDFYRRRLLELAAVLEPAGVVLGVGFDAASDRREGYAFEFIRQLDTLMMLMSMAPAKALGYVVDPWQVRAGGGSLESLKKIPVDKVGAVYLADAAEEMPANQWSTKNRILPGSTGIVDNTSVLTWLGEIGYDGPVVPAPDPSALGGQRRDAIVRQASEKLDTIWKAAGLSPLGKLSPAGAK
jgi:sugar phosphate isomerase/epimerase